MKTNRSAVMVSIVVFLFGGAALAMGQTEWVQNPENPVIEPGEPGTWDATGQQPIAVFFDGSTYHMWLVGFDDSNFPTGVGHATSPDGVEWTMDPANPVLTAGSDGEWDDHYVFGAGLIHDGTQFHMWYGGSRLDNIARAGYATSPDGSVWTKYAGNPVMDVGSPGSWDEMTVNPTTVILDGETYRMWHFGHDGNESGVGYAESSDGIHWTKRPEPVLERAYYPGSPGWEPVGPGLSCVVFDGSAYHMWYNPGGGPGEIGYAYSNDGIEWTRHRDNPVLEGSEGSAYAPTVIYDGSTFHMWYDDFDGAVDLVSYATSDCCPGIADLGHALFIPAAAVASGAQGAFFQTDVDLSNADSQPAQYQFVWLPRGETNFDPMRSETFSLGAGMSVRYANVLSEVFGLEPNSLGGLLMLSSSPDLLAMSRTYNTPAGELAGTFGQAIPAVPPDDFIQFGERPRILFASENADLRTNIGCQNNREVSAVVNIELFDADGTSLERTMMLLRSWGNDQLNRVFQDYQPVNGYVEVWTTLANGSFYCYGSVLDNVTSDPTTIPPQ